MKWVNFGGGHHITRADYDVDALIETLKGFKARYPHPNGISGARRGGRMADGGFLWRESANYYP